MKCSFFFSALFLSNVLCFSQPKVIFDFCSHNEETSVWDAPNYYTLNRAKLITLATYFQQHGITWNMQSDWTYLTNVILQDSTFFPVSGNKNILRYLSEDLGVEMDPHGHETQYIYPDLVKLMDSLGLPESKVMGGTLYSEENGINLWTNLINGQNGIVFPEKFWQPDYMMGGGTPNHVADLKYYGIWNPKSETEYLTHYPANHLRHLGVGCDIKIKAGITVEEIISDIKYVVSSVQNGTYPSDGFYLQTIFFEQGSLNNSAFYQSVVDIADSVNLIVSSNAAEWLTMKQAYTKWETVHNAEMFQWECEDVLSIDEKSLSFSNLYPNPSSGQLFIDNVQTESVLKIYSSAGLLLKSVDLAYGKNEISLGTLENGVYFFETDNQKGKVARNKIIIYKN